MMTGLPNCLLALALGASLAAEPNFFAGPPPGQGGLRGRPYLPERASLLTAGAWTACLDLSAANFLTHEINPDAFVQQRFETGRARLAGGLGLGAAEWDAHLDLDWRGSGLLNGFIAGFEQGFADLFRDRELVNPDRVGPGALRGGADRGRVEGLTWERPSSAPLGLGGAGLQAKLRAWELGRSRAAWRLALDLPGLGRGAGPSLGLGLGAEAAWPSPRLQWRSDLRLFVPLRLRDELGLGLKLAPGFSAGAEWQLAGGGSSPWGFSAGLDISSDQSPYTPTGLRAFDVPQQDLALSLNLSFPARSLRGLLRLWGREDFAFLQEGWPTLRPMALPDFQCGLGLELSRRGAR